MAAKPGDILIFWCTGFEPRPANLGRQRPSEPRGIATLPTVTVGGMQVTVIGAALSPGSAGLYQVAIQLPSNVPTGSVPIQASLNGVLSPPGVLKAYIAAQ